MFVVNEYLGPARESVEARVADILIADPAPSGRMPATGVSLQCLSSLCPSKVEETISDVARRFGRLCSECSLDGSLGRSRSGVQYDAAGGDQSASCVAEDEAVSCSGHDGMVCVDQSVCSIPRGDLCPSCTAAEVEMERTLLGEFLYVAGGPQPGEEAGRGIPLSAETDHVAPLDVGVGHATEVDGDATTRADRVAGGFMALKASNPCSQAVGIENNGLIYVQPAI